MSVPQWYSDALAQAPSMHSVDVGGVDIAYRQWGAGDRPGIVLVHGGMAHSGWWDHLAPMLARDRTVVALDLSGHGDSDRRERYNVQAWAREVMAVAADAGLTTPPFVVGHSMGGFVSLIAAAAFGEELAGVIAVDSSVREISPDDDELRRRWAATPLHSYATHEEAAGRFRLVPAQKTPVLPYVFEHIAWESVRETPGGWTWKFDPTIFASASLAPWELSPPVCRVALMPGEYGLVSPEIAAVMAERLGHRATVIEIPDASHHVMIDQPLALIAGLRAVLAEWQRSARI
jgi:pimeloyl-ACP methyl ester carboxylesterase